jgi:hypothetical protein
MNEAYDQLEAELAALRPQDASPELRRRIAAHWADPRPRSSRWRLSLALAGGLAAACAVVIFLRWGSSQRSRLEPFAVAHRDRTTPRQPFTPQHGDSATIEARLRARGQENASDSPRFSWPLDNTLTSMITPDLLE